MSAARSTHPDTGARPSRPGAREADPEAVHRVWRALHTLVHDTHDHRREASEALDMSFARVKALGRITRKPMTLRQLASALAMDAAYATLVVDDLERRGLVERTANPQDRRSKIVTATAEGRRAAQRAEEIIYAPPPVLAALNPEDLATLERIVTTLLHDDAGGTAGPAPATDT